MTSVEHIEALTKHAERLLNVVNGEEEEDGGQEDVADTLESFRKVSSMMTAACDLDVALLTVKSIIYKVVTSVREGGDLDKARLRVLVTLLILHRDLDTRGLNELTREVMETLVKCQLAPGIWLQLVTSLGDEIFLRHSGLVTSHHHMATLQAGLMSEDNIVRKRAMYLMKRTVDTLTSDSSALEDKSQYVLGPCSSKSDVQNNFESYSLIMETLEEKQVHLVRQIIPKVISLLSLSLKSEQSFHFSWILVLFFRLFKHPNIEIVRWGVSTFLTAKFQESILSDENFLSFLCNPVLEVLNETKLYTQNTEDTDEKSFDRTTSDQISNFLLSLGEVSPKTRTLIL